jgi:tetratricopeptide (TPR) repeat protein
MKSFFCSFKTRFLTALFALALTGAPLVACANQAYTADAAAAPFPLVPLSSGDLQAGSTFSGSYLAARFAQRQQDWTAAQHYMNAVVGFDENNALMTNRAFLLSLGAGELPAARHLAGRILTEQQNGTDIALIFMASEALKRGEFKSAIDLVARLPDDGFGQYTKPLMTAWALFGAGDRAGAAAHLSAYSEETDPTYNLHLGMMYDLGGDMESAAKHYAVALDDGLTLHNALLLADFFERHGDADALQYLYEGLGSLYGSAAQETSRPTAAGARRGMIRSPADGAAVALFELATMLFERRSFDSAQIYGRLVLVLAPESAFGRLMIGDIAAINEHYPEAVAAYEGIAESSPLYLLSRLRIAEVYESAELPGPAAKMLRQLAALPQARRQALTALGDMHRRREDFTQAVAVYDEILAEIGEVAEPHWALVYARGMSLERANDWDRAEKDLLLALTFQPDNPMILNYIGYTWVDKGVNLQKGMDFIRRAVALRPDDGYILDSYGWAFYRLGDMEQAVYWLEKSVALVPDDATILDHLADAYWQTERKTEARFKWRHARSLSKDASFRAAIDRKLLDGLEPAATVVVRKDTSL